MERCNTCKQMVESAPFGQCDPCFEQDMDSDGSAVYSAPPITEKGSVQW